MGASGNTNNPYPMLKLTEFPMTDDYLDTLFNTSKISTNQDALEKIIHFSGQKNGLYWGVKLYTELGWEPHDF